VRNEQKECSICGDEFTGWGNNPEPFKGEHCCDDCNDRFVVPVRMCLGRTYSNEPILTFLVTIAELGKSIARVNKEAAEIATLRLVPQRVDNQ
jgi:hypothetical protein